MKRSHWILALALGACLAFACSTDDDGDDEGNGGTIGTGGTGGTGGEEVKEPGRPDGTGGTGGVATDYLDDEGNCRSDEPMPYCPPTWEQALEMGIESFDCAGTCGETLTVLHNHDIPTYRCTYDPQTGQLVGGVVWDDVPENCGETSYEVIYRDGDPDCTFSTLEFDSGFCDSGASG